jgi:hypothetical protein
MRDSIKRNLGVYLIAFAGVALLFGAPHWIAWAPLIVVAFVVEVRRDESKPVEWS